VTERPDTHTLIGAYALDALDDGEREAFERHASSCDPCREEVESLRRTALRLADAAAVAPPERLRSRVLAQARVTPQVRDTIGTRPRHEEPAAVRSRLWLAAAAVLAVVALGAGGLAWTQYRAAEAARTEAGRIDAVVTDPGARLVQQRLAGGGTATMVVAGSRAVLGGAGMPALSADRTYQLWVIRGTRITSAGLGPAGSDGSGRWSRLVDGVQRGDVLAVSVEPDGGSAQPTTTPVVTLRA
jgi:anti-sigma-K factor RskA